jgi:hypothetical protein
MPARLDVSTTVELEVEVVVAADGENSVAKSDCACDMLGVVVAFGLNVTCDGSGGVGV